MLLSFFVGELVPPHPLQCLWHCLWMKWHVGAEDVLPLFLATFHALPAKDKRSA